MGGSDQWGNIVTGTELIRRKEGGDAFALTTPLIKKADGTKFGKSEQGNIWLDSSRTSPYKFYQYWLNTSDEDAINFIKIFTTRDEQEITDLVAEHQIEPHLRKLQSALAKDITVRVHSIEEYEMAVKASSILFGNSVTVDLQQFTIETLESVLEGVPTVSVTKEALQNCKNVTELLTEISESKIFPSKGEARKMIIAGGVSINKQKLENPNAPIDFELLHNRYLLVQKGKKNYFLISIQ